MSIIVKGKTSRLLNVIPKIGLEVHAQLNINSKLFSLGQNIGPPNSRVDLLDVAMPGTLPKLNRNAIHSAILTSLGLSCDIQNVTHWDRKNYFYTDMPAGYQITQYNQPIAKNGFVDFIVYSYHNSLIAHSQQYDIVKHLFSNERENLDDMKPYMKRSVIKQIQLEQDSAKTLHNELNMDSLIDYNRSGSGLIEIVFEPDLTNHHEAASLVRELIMILKVLRTCDCELQEGSLRVDANVSVQSIDGQLIENSSRVELKNLNSTRALNKGILEEISRQANLIDSGQTVAQESRTYDTRSGKTMSMRLKEDSVDYRYVPDPNLPPLEIDSEMIEKARQELPSVMPSVLRSTLIDKYHLDLAIVREITDEPGLGDYLIQIINEDDSRANDIADFLIYCVSNLKNITTLPLKVDLSRGGDFLERLKPTTMRTVIDMIWQEEISFAIGYELVKLFFVNNEKSDPRDVIASLSWGRINNEEEIQKLCKDCIAKMKNISKKYGKKGRKMEMKMMLDKLAELTNNRINVKKAMRCIDSILKPPVMKSQ